MTQLLDGSAIAQKMQKQFKEQIAYFKQKTNVTPCLAAILVGNNPASEIYVKKKMAAASEVGINSLVMHVELPQLEYELTRLNYIEKIHGYILQLPLPDKIDPLPYFNFIHPLKDVDVFHPENVGLLAQHRPRFKPCTPHAIQQILHQSNIEIAGKKIVIINRSNVVGKPLSLMLLQECDDYANATVTVCHDRTDPEMLKEIIAQSDIVVVAVGKPNFITADMVRPHHIIVDVGINRLSSKIVGDVDFQNVFPVVKAISPVPKGVGPLTVTCLLQNVFIAARLQCNFTEVLPPL